MRVFELGGHLIIWTRATICLSYKETPVRVRQEICNQIKIPDIQSIIATAPTLSTFSCSVSTSPIILSTSSSVEAVMSPTAPSES